MVEPDAPEPRDDGLVIPEVGPWSRHKHHFLRRYVYAFTTSMRKKWSELHYVDLFSGAGIERVRGGGLEWGSVLIAAMTQHPFAKLHLCELDPGKWAALRDRLQAFPQPTLPQLLQGDANVCVREIVDAIPSSSPNLAFVDPFRLGELNFGTLAALSERRTDLIVFLPDFLDALGNVTYYRGHTDSKLSRFLGTSDWETALEGVPRSRWPDALLRVFQAQLERIGYRYFAEERISHEGRNLRLYRLVFCSGDRAGVTLWRNVSRKLAGGQRRLFD